MGQDCRPTWNSRLGKPVLSVDRAAVLGSEYE